MCLVFPSQPLCLCRAPDGASSRFQTISLCYALARLLMSHHMFMRLFLVVLVSCIGYVYVGSVIIQHPGSALGVSASFHLMLSERV